MDAGRVYKEAAVHSSGAVGLVLTMYDMLISDLRRAILATQNGDVEARSREVKHALEVLMHLQSSIDFEQGGDTANTLDTFYAIVRAKVLQAHMRQSIELFQQQIELVQTVCGAWREVERRVLPTSSGSFNSTAVPPAAFASAVEQSSDWQA